MENLIIQTIHKWAANIMIIIFMYTTIIWFLFSQDNEKIKNNFFNLLLRLELITAIALLFAGIILLIVQPAWLDGNHVIVKIMLGFITLGLIYVSNIKTKNYIKTPRESDRKTINVIRGFAILFLMTVYTFGSMVSTRAKYGADIEYTIEQPSKNED